MEKRDMSKINLLSKIKDRLQVVEYWRDRYRREHDINIALRDKDKKKTEIHNAYLITAMQQGKLTEIDISNVDIEELNKKYKLVVKLGENERKVAIIRR